MTSRQYEALGRNVVESARYGNITAIMKQAIDAALAEVRVEGWANGMEDAAQHLIDSKCDGGPRLAESIRYLANRAAQPEEAGER